MRSGRRCSRAGCTADAVATLTYVYADSTAVLGPLATFAEPHSYDLCASHAERLTAPRGWEVVRLAVEDHVPQGPSHDDLLALVDAVREAARPRLGAAVADTATGTGGAAGSPRPGGPDVGAAGRAPLTTGTGRPTGRRGHLRVLGTSGPDGERH